MKRLSLRKRKLKKVILTSLKKLIVSSCVFSNIHAFEIYINDTSLNHGDLDLYASQIREAISSGATINDVCTDALSNDQHSEDYEGLISNKSPSCKVNTDSLGKLFVSISGGVWVTISQWDMPDATVVVEKEYSQNNELNNVEPTTFTFTSNDSGDQTKWVPISYNVGWVELVEGKFNLNMQTYPLNCSLNFTYNPLN